MHRGAALPQHLTPLVPSLRIKIRMTGLRGSKSVYGPKTNSVCCVPRTVAVPSGTPVPVTALVEAMTTHRATIRRANINNIVASLNSRVKGIPIFFSSRAILVDPLVLKLVGHAGRLVGVHLIGGNPRGNWCDIRPLYAKTLGE